MRRQDQLQPGDAIRHPIEGTQGIEVQGLFSVEAAPLSRIAPPRSCAWSKTGQRAGAKRVSVDRGAAQGHLRAQSASAQGTARAPGGRPPLASVVARMGAVRAGAFANETTIRRAERFHIVERHMVPGRQVVNENRRSRVSIDACARLGSSAQSETWP